MLQNETKRQKVSRLAQELMKLEKAIEFSCKLDQVLPHEVRVTDRVYVELYQAVGIVADASKSQDGWLTYSSLKQAKLTLFSNNADMLKLEILSVLGFDLIDLWPKQSS